MNHLGNLEDIRQQMISILTHSKASEIDWEDIRTLAEQAENEANARLKALFSAKGNYHRCVTARASFLMVFDLTVGGTLTKEDIHQWIANVSKDLNNHYRAFGFRDIQTFTQFLKILGNQAQEVAYIANEVAAGNTMWNL